jgi:hypothetical protein
MVFSRENGKSLFQTHARLAHSRFVLEQAYSSAVF